MSQLCWQECWRDVKLRLVTSSKDNTQPERGKKQECEKTLIYENILNKMLDLLVQRKHRQVADKEQHTISK